VIVNIHAAKTNLSKLIERAEAGEEVIVARNGKPVVRLTPVDPAESQPTEAAEDEGRVPSWFGSMRGQIWIAPGSEEPDEELIRLMEDGPVFPPDDEV
jgi:prevent-host-death family protein